MTKSQIRAAIAQIEREQRALFPEIETRGRPKPREPAQTGTIRNNPEQKDFAYKIGKRISQIIRRVLK